MLRQVKHEMDWNTNQVVMSAGNTAGWGMPSGVVYSPAVAGAQSYAAANLVRGGG